MKLFHLADLHLGKRVNGFSMLEDQQHILREILRLAEDEQPDAVLIAGDIYDRAVPSEEAVRMFDDFLYRLFSQNRTVLAISGNHDSPERLAFGGRMMDPRLRFAPVYDGTVSPVTLTDGFGPVHFYLLPFLKPAEVRRFFPERELSDYTGALRAAVEAMAPDTGARNVLLAHQFVTGAVRSDSEDVSVGGLDNVDAAVFDSFDYVALGHLHGPPARGAGDTALLRLATEILRLRKGPEEKRHRGGAGRKGRRDGPDPAADAAAGPAGAAGDL